MKNAFITWAETVNAGTKFIIKRHCAATSGRTQREMVRLVEIEARQRCTPREKGCECPLSEEELCKEAVKSFV